MTYTMTEGPPLNPCAIVRVALSEGDSFAGEVTVRYLVSAGDWNAGTSPVWGERPLLITSDGVPYYTGANPQHLITLPLEESWRLSDALDVLCQVAGAPEEGPWEWTGDVNIPPPH